MKRPIVRYFLLVFLLGIFSYACIKKTTYPTTPTVEYKDFLPYAGDSADLKVLFTDGDGNIGVGKNDSTRTFWYTYYYQDTITKKYEAFYRPLFNDTLRIGYVIKSPSESYKGKPVNGEFSIRLERSRHDTWVKKVKYVFYLYDAAGNKSNVVTSPEISLP